MKKAFSTVACMDLAWREVLASAVRAGMDAVEVRMDNNGSLFGLNDSELPEMINEFEKANVAISDIGTSIRFSNYDKGNVEKAINVFKLAQKTGAKAVRFFPGSFVKRFDELEKSVHDIDGMARFLNEAAAEAEKYGVEIWIETHNEFSTGRDMAKLLKLVPSGSVKVIWDAIHTYEQYEPAEETIAYLGDRIAHVHFKDGVKQDDRNLIDYRYTKLGEGTLPLKHIYDLLEINGYKGYYSLEWEKAWRSEIKEAYANLDLLLDDWSACLSGLLETK